MSTSEIPICPSCGNTVWNYVERVIGWSVSSVAFNLTNKTFDTFGANISSDDVEQVLESYFECADCGWSCDLDFERDYSE